MKAFLNGMTASLLLIGSIATAQEIPTGPYHASDSLAVVLEDGPHQEVLGPIVWEPGDFEVTIGPGESGPFGEDAIVSFPSPKPVHEPAEVDVVSADWYIARTADGAVAEAPAVVIVPETDSRRVAGRALGAALRGLHVHALVLHPPGYGKRNVGNVRRDVSQFLVRYRQGIADARRTKDAAAVLPGIRGHRVHLGGISLGGFSAILTESLDNGFDQTFVMLAGGDLYGIVTNGQRDAIKFREGFAAAGYEGQDLKDLLNQLEPLRVADRLEATRTWLITAQFDDVVPPENSLKFAETAQLPADHHITYPTDHYSAALMLPTMAKTLADLVLQLESEQSAN
jgi:hypothetical protein